MQYERNVDWLYRRRIICRRLPLTDKPTENYDWGWYYENGTHQCFDLFRTNNKINTFKSLKWHLLVLWYLNSNITQDEFETIANFICDKQNGFVTFTASQHVIKNIIYEVSMYDLEKQPNNRVRKIIFKPFCGLTKEQKLKIVGSMIGRSKTITEDDIYSCMLEINNNKNKVTVSGIAKLLSCSTRTIYRNMGNELKKEKELLNKQI